MMRADDRLGGIEGNELLTIMAAAVLVALLAAEGLTILWLGDLRTEHMFIGLVLLGPLAVKLGSVGYRMARYYTRARAYREKGPPALVLRLLAPVLVASTLLIFTTGVVLLADGHRSDFVLELHKIGFIVWSGCFAVHLLWYAPRAWSSLRAVRRERVPGALLRTVMLSASLGGGLTLALVLLSAIESWHGR